jgi:hypothetical protein
MSTRRFTSILKVSNVAKHLFLFHFVICTQEKEYIVDIFQKIFFKPNRRRYSKKIFDLNIINNTSLWGQRVKLSWA